MEEQTQATTMNIKHSAKKVVRVGLIGSGFISAIHYDALQHVPNSKVVAQADINKDLHEAFIKERPIEKFYSKPDEMFKDPEIDFVILGVPNIHHAPIAKAALKAGKHIMVEKPLCLTMEDAEEICDLANKNGLIAGYGEELCYIPKYERLKQIVDSGALGDVYMIRQCEKHEGPHSKWFFTRDYAGGGALMDMGCHAIEFCRWMKNKMGINWVMAHCAIYNHSDSEVEDHVIATMEFQDGSLGCIESSWALQGGDESYAEVFGKIGYAKADSCQGTGLRIFAPDGYPSQPMNVSNYGGDGVEVRGWSNADYEWLWNNGYPQEMQDFVSCIQNGGTPVESAEDGKVVLEIMQGIYQSAATGKRVYFPFKSDVERPIDSWLNRTNQS